MAKTVYDIYVNVQRERVLYSRSAKPVIEGHVGVQIYRRGNRTDPLVRQFYKQTEEQLKRWEALQDKLAANRPAF